MIEYKALEAGIPTEMIDPRNTSKKCNECGQTADSNRDSVYFHCTDCGYQVNADVNGAFNIAVRSAC
jgi:putative transposase